MGEASSSWRTAAQAPRGDATLGQAADRSPHWLSSGPMAAQQCIERAGAFFGEENPRPGEFDRWLCPRDRIGKPVGPFHRKVDVIRRPNDQGRSAQLA